VCGVVAGIDIWFSNIEGAPGQWQCGGGFVTVLSASTQGHSHLGRECQCCRDSTVSEDEVLTHLVVLSAAWRRVTGSKTDLPAYRTVLCVPQHSDTLRKQW
jgi:hypothetical protein